ncbi:MAG: hypothetical protein LBU60_06375 [Clostridiales bacterium]|nr:hypothetical protein [Clostridiales bacterium]
MENTNEQQNFATKRPHSITIDSRKRGLISGVDKVVSSNDISIILHTSEGALQIMGKDFKIKKFSQEEGVLAFEGDLESLKYANIKQGTSGGMLKKMFK